MESLEKRLAAARAETDYDTMEVVQKTIDALQSRFQHDVSSSRWCAVCAAVRCAYQFCGCVLLCCSCCCAAVDGLSYTKLRQRLSAAAQARVYVCYALWQCRAAAVLLPSGMLLRGSRLR
jgi:hypothetical protein